MKKLVSLMIIGAAAVTLSACSTDGSADYTYEQKAPFADERTVGTVPEKAPMTAEKVFTKSQTK